MTEAEAELLEEAAVLLADAVALDVAREAAEERANLLGTAWRKAASDWMRREAACAGVAL